MVWRIFSCLPSFPEWFSCLETLMRFNHSDSSNSLPPRHLLCYVQHQSPLTFFHVAEVGACPSNAKIGLSMYRVAVLLFG
jgi:hypothetical protein